MSLFRTFAAGMSRNRWTLFFILSVAVLLLLMFLSRGRFRRTPGQASAKRAEATHEQDRDRGMAYSSSLRRSQFENGALWRGPGGALPETLSWHLPLDPLRPQQELERSLKLRILDAGSLDPIPGALVLAAAAGASMPSAAARSDDDGRATIALPGGMIELGVRKEGYASARIALEPPGDGGQPIRDVFLDRIAPLTGFVIGPDNRGIPRVRLRFQRLQDSACYEWGWTATGDSGAFRIELCDGLHEYMALTAFFSDVHGKITVDAGNQEPLIIRLRERREAVRISGAVFDIDSRRPISDASVRADIKPWQEITQYPSFTDSEGRFELEVPLPAQGRITASKPGYEPTGTEVPLAVSHERALFLRKSRSFTVRVYDVDRNEISSGFTVKGHAPNAPLSLVPLQRNEYTSPTYPMMIYAHGLRLGWGFTTMVLLDQYRPEVHLSFEVGGTLQIAAYCADMPVNSYRLMMSNDTVGGEVEVNSGSGRYTVKYLNPGKYTLHLESEGSGKATRAVTIAAMKTTDVRVDLLNKK